MAIVNRAIEKQLILVPSVDLTIVPHETFPANVDCELVSLASHFRRSPPDDTQLHVRHGWPPRFSRPTRGHVILFQPWEYGWLPETYVKAMNAGIDELWVPSTYVRDVYLTSMVKSERVQIIPYGVDSSLFTPCFSRSTGLRDSIFRFLFVGGLLYRKGVDCLLRAYIRFFHRTDDVVLVIKDVAQYGRNRYRDLIEDLRSDSCNPRIELISDNLTEIEMVDLYRSCDCLVHPYRGEGFALPVLEAMSCGLPVIVTLGGATDDFVDDSCGFRISATKRTLGNREIMGLRCAGDPWLLEPSISELGDTMLDVFRNPTKAKALGAAARSKVTAAWTWKRTTDLILSRMHVILATDRSSSFQPPPI